MHEQVVHMHHSYSTCRLSKSIRFTPRFQDSAAYIVSFPATLEKVRLQTNARFLGLHVASVRNFLALIRLQNQHTGHGDAHYSQVTLGINGMAVASVFWLGEDARG